MHGLREPTGLGPKEVPKAHDGERGESAANGGGSPDGRVTTIKQLLFAGGAKAPGATAVPGDGCEPVGGGGELCSGFDVLPFFYYSFRWRVIFRACYSLYIGLGHVGKSEISMRGAGSRACYLSACRKAHTE